MQVRKYTHFIVEFPDEESFETDSWREAFARFYKKDSATLYGLPNHEGASYVVVLSR